MTTFLGGIIGTCIIALLARQIPGIGEFLVGPAFIFGLVMTVILWILDSPRAAREARRRHWEEAESRRHREMIDELRLNRIFGTDSGTQGDRWYVDARQVHLTQIHLDGGQAAGQETRRLQG